VEDAFDRQLVAQDLALRQVILVLSHARARLPCVVPGPEWAGPASQAYHAAVDGLRTELAAVEERLQAASRFTRQALATRARP